MGLIHEYGRMMDEQERKNDNSLFYGWIITTDYLWDQMDVGDHSDEGVMGPRDIPDNLRSRLENDEGTVFRMYDDDGELYYEGRYVNNENDELVNSAFGPMDDFGGPAAGVTSMKYFVNGKWVTL